MLKNKGIFYVVSTPIGNLNDISFRAVEILKQVKTIYAEDTRHSAKLMQHYNIKTQMQSCHTHNEAQKIAQVLTQLQNGEDLALISDAGTPLLSDPGFLLTREIIAAGFQVAPIPGASALLSALVASGLNCTKFSFLGFLSSKRHSRFAELEKIKYAKQAHIIYEAPHRLLDFLQDAVEVFGDSRKICLGREITKTYETFITKPSAELLEFVQTDKNQQKGEFVIIIDAFVEDADLEEEHNEELILAEKLLQDLLEYVPPAKISSILAKNLNLQKKQIYNLALSLTQSKPK